MWYVCGVSGCEVVVSGVCMYEAEINKEAGQRAVSRKLEVVLQIWMPDGSICGYKRGGQPQAAPFTPVLPSHASLLCEKP